MKCEHCGKNEVTFVYHSSINGQVDEKHLCGQCAEELGYTRHLAAQSRRMMRGLGGMFGSSLFDDFFSPMPSLLGRSGFPGRGGWLLEDPFDDFFTEMPALRPAAPGQEVPQPQEKREGLLEQEEQSRFSRLRQKNALRMEMKRAVRQENFERAAELRDQLRALEAEEPRDAGESQEQA